MKIEDTDARLAFLDWLDSTESGFYTWLQAAKELYATHLSDAKEGGA